MPAERIPFDLAVETAKKTGTEVVLAGQGLIGALAAIPFCAKPLQSVSPEV